MFRPVELKEIPFGPAYFAKNIIATKRISFYFGIRRKGTARISKKIRESVICMWMQKQHPKLVNDYYSAKKNFNVNAHRWVNYQNYHPDQLSWPPPNFYSDDLQIFGADLDYDLGEEFDFDGDF